MISGDTISGYPISGYSQPEVSSGTLFFQSISASITRTAAVDKTIVFSTSISANMTRSAAVSASSVFTSTISAVMARIAAVNTIFTPSTPGAGLIKRIGIYLGISL